MLILRSIAFGIPPAQEVTGEESFLRHDPLMMADASNRSQVSQSHKPVKRSSITLIPVILFASQTSRSQQMQVLPEPTLFTGFGNGQPSSPTAMFKPTRAILNAWILISYQRLPLVLAHLMMQESQIQVGILSQSNLSWFHS
jgi:hypothetical protein